MRAKKSFGQRFLNQEAIAERIAYSLQLEGSYKKILEVGPGRGMLTKHLLKRPEELVVVEADKDMVLYIQKHFPQLKGQIIAQDFLKLPLESFFPDKEPFALIGNYPYNISSQILFKMLDLLPKKLRSKVVLYFMGSGELQAHLMNLSSILYGKIQM